MKIHEEVLRAARRIGRERGDWRFTTGEIVRALPELNVNSVRTHVISRCCVNAPKNHPHKWDYFQRVHRGVYEILPVVRETQGNWPARGAESASASAATPRRDSVYAVVSRNIRVIVVECREVPVVAQGNSLDEAIANLREALTQSDG